MASTHESGLMTSGTTVTLSQPPKAGEPIAPSRQSPDIAINALQYLPTPLLVVSSNTKRIVLANKALYQLLDFDQVESDETARTSDRSNVVGQCLLEAGIAILQEGNGVWVEWDKLLDGLRPPVKNPIFFTDYDATKLAQTTAEQKKEEGEAEFFVKPAQVDVVFTRSQHGPTDPNVPKSAGNGEPYATSQQGRLWGKMIISPFWSSGALYYTLTMIDISTSMMTELDAQASEIAAIESQLLATGEKVSSFSAVLGEYARQKQANRNEAAASTRPPPTPQIPSALQPKQDDMQLTILQKIFVMKNALLDTMEVPVFVTWLDGSITLPNKAALTLASSEIPSCSDIGYIDSKWMSKYLVYDKDFKAKLAVEDYPMSILCRERKPIEGVRVGLINMKGEKGIFDCSGRGKNISYMKHLDCSLLI